MSCSVVLLCELLLPWLALASEALLELAPVAFSSLVLLWELRLLASELLLEFV